jgi:TonB-linked SusC/RagA family outer membrane protein
MSLWLYAQHNVSGIANDQTGEPLPGVNISVKGTTRGVISDVEGKYTLSVPGGNTVLVFSYVGYQTQEIAIGNRSVVNVSMRENVQEIEEIVVVGYGTQSIKKITAAISKLDHSVLENIPYTNVTSALQGTIPGLRVQTTSGMPGAAPRVIMRGGTSISSPNSSAPLYIVDGLIKGNMSDIFSDDIESIQVLKDAASTAIYGARGSNGIVIVTTKKGKPGKFSLNYSYSVSSSEEQRLMKYSSARDYIYYSRWALDEGRKLKPEMATSYSARLTGAYGYGTGNDLTSRTAFTTMYKTPDNEYKLNEGWEEMIDPVDPSKIIIFKDTDFQKLTYQQAITHKHHVSASGGDERFEFNSSLGYIQGEGITISSDYQRFNFLLNASAKITKNLKINSGLLYALRVQHTVPLSNANTFYRNVSLPSSAKYTFEDGSLSPGVSSSVGNPHYYLTGPGAPVGKQGVEITHLYTGGKWDIIPGLSFEPQLTAYKGLTYTSSFQPAYLSGTATTTNTRVASESQPRTTIYQIDAVLTYIKSLTSGHNIEAKAGYSYSYRQNTSFSVSARDAVTDNIPTINASSTYTSASTTESNQVLSGWFGRINYDYKTRYLLSLNARYDGASNFGSQSRYGFFPGVSIGWNVDNESFWQDFLPRNFMELKLRSSYGVNGNLGSLGDYQAQGSYNVSSVFAGVSAITVGDLPNQNLKWEESKTFDLGFDATLFERRLSIIFDYYDRITDNLLTTLTLPYSTGFASIYTNFGSLQNKGYEIGAAVNILPHASKIRWEIAANAAYVKTTILKLPDNGIENNRQGGVQIYDPATGQLIWRGGLQEGGRIGDMFSIRALGVYTSDEDAAKAPIQEYQNSRRDKTKFGGDVIWEDRDGDGKITSVDQDYMGNQYPEWTGGFSTILRYGGFSLSARFDYTLGHTIYNYAKAFADGALQGDLMPTQDFLDKSWKKQGDITDTPRYWWQNMQGNITYSSSYLEKGDFLCFREASFSYTLPSSLLHKLPVKNVRFHLTGNNLYYFTGYTGVIPEEGGQDNGHYPIPRTYTLGLNVTF